jgi:hypothetical protein
MRELPVLGPVVVVGAALISSIDLAGDRVAISEIGL